MKLYLARHGAYHLDVVQGLDALTEQGTNDIKQLVSLLKPWQLSVASILHSGKHRAQQTAELLTEAFHSAKPPLVHAGLKPDDDIADIVAEITHSDEDMLIVGHLPFMGRLVSQLLTGNDAQEIVNFQTGTLVCLSQLDKTHWMIDWVLAPTP